MIYLYGVIGIFVGILLAIPINLFFDWRIRVAYRKHTEWLDKEYEKCGLTKDYNIGIDKALDKDYSV